MADAVDVFLYDPASESLIAVAGSDSTIGPRQRATWTVQHGLWSPESASTE